MTNNILSTDSLLWHSQNHKIKLSLGDCKVINQIK